MKKYIYSTAGFLLLPVLILLLSSFYKEVYLQQSLSFPYQKAGLTKQQAAAHLLSRFSFGATPGQVEQVANTGLEAWFANQLLGNKADTMVDAALANFESLKMTNKEIVQTFPKGGQVLKMAIQDGVIAKEDVKTEKKDSKKQVLEYMKQKGIKPQAELLRQLMAQKIVRAAYSNNQLTEVLTDFWYNHFNVAISKGGVQQFVTSYERDVIRPNVLGKFETLLLATAKSPAMLTYLDNNKSTVNEDMMGDEQKAMATVRNKVIERAQDKMMDGMDSAQRNAAGKIKKPKMQGLNENYAREIMELHTLGVDGGYTQTDVTQAARVLTGWTLNPQIEYGIKPKRLPSQTRLQKMGFVYDDNFLFAANKHDRGEKKVLGVTFPAGGGYEEGEKLIHLLATHDATAKFIVRKLAVRFVNDAPPQALIDKLAKTFLASGGDIKEVLTTLVNAPEFWASNAIREKTKSPFELTISAIRSTGAQIAAPYQLYQWMNKMGQKLYNYQAPTGFPDRGQYWINTGSLLNRMNFGLALASGRIPGVKVNLLALNAGREPESAEQALKIFSSILMPQRDVTETIKRLTPMLNDPELQEKIDEAAGKTATSQVAIMEDKDDDEMMGDKKKGVQKLGGKKAEAGVQYATGNNSMLGQIVGIIIGSPEFQRR